MLTIHPDTNVSDICATLDAIAAGRRDAQGRFLSAADVATLHKLSDLVFRLGCTQGNTNAVNVWFRALDLVDVHDQLT